MRAYGRWTRWRSWRYTGSGGVNGQVMIDGRVWLSRAKRYASAIRPEHVRTFASLCTARGLPGLFFHTGHTGESGRDAIDRHTGIEIVSGQRLLVLITGGALSIGGRAL